MATTECTCEDLASLPGDTCDDAGNMRRLLTEDRLGRGCNQVACQTCDGFEGPVEWNGCVCACDAGNVVCSSGSWLPGPGSR